MAHWEQRQAQSVPVLQTFKGWLDIQANAVLPKSALGNAVQYTLKNWEGLLAGAHQPGVVQSVLALWPSPLWTEAEPIGFPFLARTAAPGRRPE
ncbi:MAG: IS66 family transposase, partial [Steroidobacteraceae bacterium]